MTLNDLNVTNYVIRTILDKETGEPFEIVSLDFHVAKEPEFVASAKALGCRVIEPKTTDTSTS